MIAETDLAWMAGIFDVKYKSIQRYNSHASKLSIFVHDKEFPVVKRVSDLTGSNVQPSSSMAEVKEFMRRKCSDHCNEKHLEYDVSLRKHQWRSTGISAAIILYNVQPYMLHQQDLGLDQKMWETIANARYTGSGSTTIIKCMNRLSRLGWELPREMMDRLLELGGDEDE